MNSLWMVGLAMSEVVPVCDDGTGPTEYWNELRLIVAPTRGRAKSIFMTLGVDVEYIDLQSTRLDEINEPEGEITEKHPVYQNLWGLYSDKIDALVDRFRDV